MNNNNTLLWKDMEWAYNGVSGKNLFQKWVFKSLYWVLYIPLFIFYLAGPKWLGAWEGRNFTDICSYDTNIEAQYWTKHPQECKDHIQKLYHQWLSPLVMILYLIFIYTFLVNIVFPWCKSWLKFGYEKVILFINKISDYFLYLYSKF